MATPQREGPDYGRVDGLEARGLRAEEGESGPGDPPDEAGELAERVRYARQILNGILEAIADSEERSVDDEADLWRQARQLRKEIAELEARQDRAGRGSPGG